LGGIYALERIARDSEKDHWTIIEVLTAYVREHAQWKQEHQEQADKDKKELDYSWMSAPPPSQDIQAILTVIGRRSLQHETGKPYRLDLREVNLRRASFERGNFATADFVGAHLERAHFRGADGSNADFGGAFLEDTDFRGAKLTTANLETSLKGTDFREGTDLTGANVTQKAIDQANGDHSTILPVGLKRPSHWPP
jgi:hypothetical protein